MRKCHSLSAFSVKGHIHGLLAILLVLLFSLASAAETPLNELQRRLVEGRDFRVRVQAALELGKLRETGARRVLERGLADRSAAVRAAAIAALQSRGDARAVPALRPLVQDRSPAVRRQAVVAIDALEHAKQLRPGHFRVSVATVNDRKLRSKALRRHLKRVAETQLKRVKGVMIERVPSADETTPRVVFSGKLERLRTREIDGAVRVSAKVEFVISMMPGRIIKGRISGAATVHGDANKAGHRERKHLRREAIEAATESALGNAERALRAICD